MSFIDKFTANTGGSLRSTCKANADKAFFSSMFEREWEVLVIRQDPLTGNFKSETICCDEAQPAQDYVVRSSAV